jgi:hypothetical protein
VRSKSLQFLEFWQPSILVNRDIGFDLVRYGIDAFHRIKQNIIEKCLDGGINFVPAGKLLDAISYHGNPVHDGEHALPIALWSLCCGRADKIVRPPSDIAILPGHAGGHVSKHVDVEITCEGSQVISRQGHAMQVHFFPPNLLSKLGYAPSFGLLFRHLNLFLNRRVSQPACGNGAGGTNNSTRKTEPVSRQDILGQNKQRQCRCKEAAQNESKHNKPERFRPGRLSFIWATCRASRLLSRGWQRDEHTHQHQNPRRRISRGIAIIVTEGGTIRRGGPMSRRIRERGSRRDGGAL